MSDRISLPMHCDQCEQTAHQTACIDRGVCGKDADVESLQKLLLYGLKGMAAYKSHARRLGHTDPEVEAFLENALFSTMTNVNFDLEHMFEIVMECGRMNLRTMKLLNDAHIEKLGVPSPIEVTEGIQEGPGILVTGHDLADLALILEQTADTGIKVYTHGEMLPAHMYPGLRAHPHLVGHYGSAWQRQRRDFERFGGPIVATTNCVVIPRERNNYGDRLYTMHYTGVPGSPRVIADDLAPVIARALAIGPLQPTETRTSTIGFHAAALEPLMDDVLAAVESGQLEHVFVIGGCDGAEPGRNYYLDYATSTPQSSIILTLGCGKYRIRDADYGTVAGLPRLLDMGQCNDAYSAIQVALALADALDCGVNDLPLTLVLSWFEQKAVAVLLSLLALGIKGIRLGPQLPAFVTPNVLARLQREFDLRPIGSDAAADVAQVLATAS